MDVQWGTLDDEGERFRGKDAADIVSATFYLAIIKTYLVSGIDI